MINANKAASVTDAVFLYVSVFLYQLKDQFPDARDLAISTNTRFAFPRLFLFQTMNSVFEYSTSIGTTVKLPFGLVESEKLRMVMPRPAATRAMELKRS